MFQVTELELKRKLKYAFQFLVPNSNKTTNYCNFAAIDLCYPNSYFKVVPSAVHVCPVLCVISTTTGIMTVVKDGSA